MNRKNTLIVVFMVIGALVVSAFSLAAITNENNKASLQRGREADAARYTAMAESYTANDGAGLQRGRDADAARYTASARYYEAQNVTTLSANEVSAYRWQAMADFYASQAAATVKYGPPGR